MRQTITPVVGLPEFRGWAQVVSNEGKSLTCALSVVGIDAGSVGSELSTQLQSSQLNSAAELHQLLEDLLDICAQKDVKLHLACALRLGQKLVLAAIQAMVVIKKQDKVGTLLDAGGDLQVVTGSLEEEDIVVLLTKKATNFTGEINQKLTQGYDVDTIVTSLVPGVHADEDTALVAIAFIQMSPAKNSEEFKADKPATISPKVETKADEPARNASHSDTDKPLTEPEATPLAEFSKEDADNDLKAFDEDFDVPDLSGDDINSESESEVSRPRKEWRKYGSRASQVLTQASQKTVGVFQNIKNVGNLKSIIPSKTSSRFSSTPDVYIGQDQDRKQLLRRGAGGLIVIVILVAFLSVQFWRINTQKSAAREIVDPLLEKFATAQEKAEQDPISARREIEIVMNDLKSAQTKFENQSHALSLVTEKYQEVEQFYQEISGREEFQELATFYDLRLAESDFIVHQADLFKNQAVFLDREKKNIILLNLESKEATSLKTQDIDKINDLAFDGDSVFTLGSGLHEVSLSDKSPQSLREEGDSNKDANFIGLFGRYLYVFNPEKRNIYRYSPSDDGYSDPVGWLRSKKDLEFDQITSF